jgi:hypothetical protein
VPDPTPPAKSDQAPARPTLHCPRCRHELTGLPGTEGIGDWADLGGVLTCPECGSPTTLMAALDGPEGGRGPWYFVLWLVSVLMVLVLAGCVVSIIVAVVWSAVSPQP